MSRFDELPPDQRAALSLLLQQRKTYGELATALGISEQAVHDRAHAALAVLAPRQARDVAAERREEIGDYLLGQQRGVAERLGTRTFLSADEPARAWAQELAGELAPMASDTLPDIPAASAAPPQDNGAERERRDPVPAGGAAPGSSAGSAPGSSAGSATGRSGSPLPSSRLGGALLLAAIVAAIVVAVILLSGGNGSHAKSTGASGGASASTKTSTSSTGPKVDQRLSLKSPSGGPAVAVVEILSEGGKRAFYMAAEHLPASKGFYYAIWLYNSPSSFEPLSRSPTVTSNERLAGGALLPSNAGNYHEMIVTRETASKPAKPGSIVLRGAFSLGG
ncbi:MAG: hypothetical protein JWL67_2177 [Solirubrobacterales bacterium]|nr:hypothetical protein [Solirubrobacterales bacterium]